MGAAKRLITMYLNNHASLLESLAAAARQGDMRAVRSAVHDIRGSCVLFSAGRCLRLARQIEETLRGPVSGMVVAPGQQMATWVADCLELCEALDEMASALRGALAEE